VVLTFIVPLLISNRFLENWIAKEPFLLAIMSQQDSADQYEDLATGLGLRSAADYLQALLNIF
jgi:hypothetical protein